MTLPGAERVTQETLNNHFKDLWPKALQALDVPDAVRCEIGNRLNTLPLANGARR